MTLIVAATSNWGIGKNGKLLYYIQEDLHRFKQITTGNSVVMGYNTFLSLPEQKPLPDRSNIVLTSKSAYEITPQEATGTFSISSAINFHMPGLFVCNSVDTLLVALGKLTSEERANVFVIGGAMVYKLLVDYCEKALITRIHATPSADTYMIDMDIRPGWELTKESETQYFGDIVYNYCEYENKKQKW